MSTYSSSLIDLPRPEDIESCAHTEVLIANSRLNQARIRAAVDAVFAKYPALGAKFEPFCGGWTSWPGGGWTWGVETPGVAVADVIARQRGRFDMRIGRLFTVYLIPGAPDRLVLTASHLCMDDLAWQIMVEDLVTAYGGGVLERKPQDA